MNASRCFGSRLVLPWLDDLWVECEVPEACDDLWEMLVALWLDEWVPEAWLEVEWLPPLELPKARDGTSTKSRASLRTQRDYARRRTQRGHEVGLRLKVTGPGRAARGPRPTRPPVGWSTVPRPQPDLRGVEVDAAGVQPPGYQALRASWAPRRARAYSSRRPQRPRRCSC
jgi:hypothetical protein